MEDLEKGLNEKGLIDFVKTVLLSGTNPRGNEAVENLKWGIRQYRKQLLLHSVGNQRELLISFCKHGGIQNLVPTKAESIEQLVDDFLSN